MNLIAIRPHLALPALASAILIAGCAALAGPRTLVLTEGDLAKALQRQMPVERRMLEVLEIKLSEPQVHLLPQDNRVALELDVSTRDRLFGRHYQGHISLDFGLRHDETGHAIRLDRVRVNQFLIRDLPPNQQAQIGRLGSLIGEQLLKDLAIYRFKPQDLKTAEGMGYTPGTVTVTARGVEVTLVPMKP